MSYNQFTTVRINEDKLEISGTTRDLTPVTEINVAVAALPSTGGFPGLFAECEFYLAKPLQGEALKNPWTAVYTMSKPGQFALHERVLVTGRATYPAAIDVWAETIEIISIDEDPPTKTSP